ncbi:MAG: peptidoglycan editing factor PgeF [Candidatus Marinimicrobia bacterium]|nr:peptidoglycan editing factor PgeF [Candidatus Neomarinimicrobiota bacterium]MDD5582199.1 peptidoglycan editing factor PgeF [Candidatus Neomarinimicrobiota bacterium]
MDPRYFDIFPFFDTMTGTLALTTTRKFFDEGLSSQGLKEIVFKKLGWNLKNAVWPVQCHSGHVIFTRNSGPVPECDGIITDREDLILLVSTADCVPVFIADKRGEMRGLIHAGWRGLKENIVVHAVTLFQENGISQDNMVITTGPSICEKCYEIGQDVASFFPGHTYVNEHKKMLNLKNIIREQLLQRGIPSENILLTNRCTRCQKERYVSYRHNKTDQRLLSLLRK